MAKITVAASLAVAAIVRIARAGYADIVHDGATEITVNGASEADLLAIIAGVSADEVDDPVKAAAKNRLISAATRVRAAAAGTADPAKLAEYADKAANAAAVIDGTAAIELIDEAETEAPRYGLTTAAQTAALWQQRAGELRVARLAINEAERDGLAAIDAASDPGAVAIAENGAVAAVLALLS